MAVDLEDLVGRSTLVFSGAISRLNASTVPIVPARENLAVVRVEKGLRVDPALGDLAGRDVTVALRDPATVRLKHKLVFFTLSWIHGDGIAVRELAHLDGKEERAVAAAVARLPELHLVGRLRDAQAVVVATVAAVRPLPSGDSDRDAPRWAQADLDVERVLKGSGRERASVLFPTSAARPWQRAPRFREGQRAIVLLHGDDPGAAPYVQDLGEAGLTALDPADVQPESHLDELVRLLRSDQRKAAR